MREPSGKVSNSEPDSLLSTTVPFSAKEWGARNQCHPTKSAPHKNKEAASTGANQVNAVFDRCREEFSILAHWCASRGSWRFGCMN
jgi:hypothetical protein